MWWALIPALLTVGAFLGALVTLLRTGQPAGPIAAEITLIIAVTGRNTDLDRLCAALAAQVLKPARVVFAVESESDPAFSLLTGIRARHVFHIHVAGPATASSQKAHNLASAIAAFDDGMSTIAFADADIMPQSGWLADLTRPITRKAAGMVSGYRWSSPVDAQPASLLCAWIDRAIACLPKFAWQTMVWGGSLAVAPGVLARINAVRVLDENISDDMALAAAAKEANIRALHRMRVLVPSPLSHSRRTFWSFAYRQYQMLWLYQPRVWALAAALVGASLLVKTALWIAALYSSFWLAILIAFIPFNWATYALRLLRAEKLHCLSSASFGVEAAMFLVPLFGPLVDAIHLAAILRGAFARHVDWSHLSYDLRGRVVTRVIRRPQPGDPRSGRRTL
ncbi:glycosyltransferase family 2 protein [soil metagenome]